MVFKTATSGLDDCDETSMCWDVNPVDGVGTCVPFCVGSLDNPWCDALDRSCFQSNDVIALCLPLCDPLDQDCSEGSACLPAASAGGFVCMPDVSGPGGGAVGDACLFINVCDPGSYCAAPADLNDCVAVGCCAPFCDLEVGAPCQKPSVCVPFYDEGDAPAGYEDVGFCGAG